MKNSKPENLITVAVFLVIIFAFSAAFFILPDESFSEQENRTLQTAPEFTLARLISGEYSSEINAYFADQFPLRDFFVGVKGVAEAAMLKRENNGVVLADDGVVAVRNMYVDEKGAKSDFYDEETVSAALEIVRNFDAEMKKRSIDTAILFPPRVLDVASSELPALFPSYRTDGIYDLMKTELEGTGYIDLEGMYREKYEAGEYVYYRTDHHWTTLGAYYAYVEIMKSFGMEWHDISEFDIETASEEFYGTTWSRSGFKFIAPDTLCLFHLKNEDENSYTSTIRDISWTGGAFNGFYDRSMLDVKDKYAVFLGGSHTHTSIEKAGTAREKLLLVKDSFGHSLAPFLALHFDIEMVDLTYSESGINSYFDDYDFDKVVVVFNTENVITTQYLGRLRVRPQATEQENDA